MVYWRLLERDEFEAEDAETAETELGDMAGASCFETALEMEWPVVLDRSDAVRESMVVLFLCGCWFSRF